MPDYDFRCSHPKCKHEFVIHMGMRANIEAAKRGFTKVGCPKCRSNKPKRLIRPESLHIDCFGTHHSGTFDSSDGRHPPEMNGIEFTNRKGWEKAREEYGIANKGKIDPTGDQGEVTFDPNEDLSAVQMKVIPEVVKLLRAHKAPMDYDALARSVSTAPYQTVRKCLLKAATAGILVRPKPGMYALPG